MTGPPALRNTVAAWREPEYGPRARAVKRYLASSSGTGFTEEELAFAVNQAMDAWQRAAPELPPAHRGRLALTVADARPLGAWVPVWLALQAGWRVLLDPKSDPLLVAFANDAADRGAALPLLFEASEPDARAHVGAGAPEGVDWAGGATGCVAVVSGPLKGESGLRLAEDLLLFGGRGRYATRLLLAPPGLEPDGLLEALALFQEAFLVPPARAGTFAMQRAFLAASKTPHAWGEGFLLVKGEPAWPDPGQIRWVETARPHADLATFDGVRPLVLTQGDAAGEPGPSVPFGEAHRPPLQGHPDLDPFRAWLRAR